MMKLLTQALHCWWMRDPFSRSAAAAYYSIFSLPGLLIIVMGMSATLFDQQSIENEVIGHIRTVLGYDVARNIDQIIDETQHGDRDSWAIIVGGLTLAFGATALFVQLQKSLNEIWHVEVRKRAHWIEFIHHRVTAFGIIIAIGFLLMTSLTITAWLTALGDWLAARVPDYALYAIYIVNFCVSYFINSFLFALIFKVLPDVHVRWKFALAGGVFSATLFIIGEYALTLYFKIASPGSAFGAAGSLVLLLLWVFYSCAILLLGAEFTRLAAQEEHVPVQPTAIAKKKRD